MSRDDLETGFGGFLLTHRHSKDGTVIFGEEKLVTSLSAHLVINLFLLEAIGHQYFLDCVNSQEVAGAVVQELEQRVHIIISLVHAYIVVNCV